MRWHHRLTQQLQPAKIGICDHGWSRENLSVPDSTCLPSGPGPLALGREDHYEINRWIVIQELENDLPPGKRL
jgi:hypothetical protein